MFVDDVTLIIKAGNGGNGAVAFRHEKFVAKGGPFGGDGGRGGSVYFIGDEGMTTLLDLKYKRKIVALNGQNGMTKNCFGAAADDVYIKVPIGSIIQDVEKDIIIGDITKHGQEVLVCKGGKGGRGNSSFANARISAPEYAEQGEIGEEKKVRIQLKILADVGLIGFPSVGKSTLISVISNSKPKIADYPFTTLIPNIGVVKGKGDTSFVVADMPGLIEGASLGAGLGIEFLKHIERTRVLVHVIDMDSVDERDPYDDFLKINKELGDFNPKLLLRPQIIAANKMDLPNAKNNLEEFKKKLEINKDSNPIADIVIVPISAYTKNNLEELIDCITDKLSKINIHDFDDEVNQDEVVEYVFEKKEKPFKIEKTIEGLYNVTGPEIEKLFNATDFNRDESVKLFARKIKQLGVDDALKKLGVDNNDTVLILGYEFEFYD
ncbi:MAG: GTPase ObgE [Bacilli bacterium]|nr:GTPase ObgE [Bacilli bacterium]